MSSPGVFAIRNPDLRTCLCLSRAAGKKRKAPPRGQDQVASDKGNSSEWQWQVAPRVGGVDVITLCHIAARSRGASHLAQS
jgi:hypothetical protein